MFGLQYFLAQRIKDTQGLHTKGSEKRQNCYRAFNREEKLWGAGHRPYAFKVGLVQAEKELLEEETANDALIMTREQHFLFLLINFEQMKWQPS